MRDVSAKVSTLRTATAKATLFAAPETIRLVREGGVPKGDPIPVARVAAVQAAKSTPLLIPYCHPVPLDFIKVDFEIFDNRIEATVFTKAIYKTGVEMEALAGAIAAVLNLYDMLKMLDEEMYIGTIVLLEKTGGKSNFTPNLSAPFRAAVLVCSDRVSQGASEDRSGLLLKQLLLEQGADVISYAAIADEVDEIQSSVKRACDELHVDMLFITGGTGVGPRDVTPEAVRPILTSDLAGVEAFLHRYSQERLPFAMLSRLCIGRRGNAFVFCLPGSPGAIQDAIDALFPYVKHALAIRDGAGHG